MDPVYRAEDIEIWRVTRESPSAADLTAHLRESPDSDTAETARKQRLDQLQTPEPEPEPEGFSLSLSLSFPLPPLPPIFVSVCLCLSLSLCLSVSLSPSKTAGQLQRRSFHYPKRESPAVTFATQGSFRSAAPARTSARCLLRTSYL